MHKDLIEQAEDLIRRLELKATGANIHEYKSTISLLYVYCKFIEQGLEIEKHKEKLLEKMEEARRIVFK